MNTVRLEIEFAEELEDPVATVTEIALAIRDAEVVKGLRSTDVKPVAVRGCVPEAALLGGHISE